MGFNTATMGGASLALQAGGLLTSTVGSLYSARSQASGLGHQANLAEINARIADLGAESALEQGKQQVAERTLRAGQERGAQRAALAANGVALNEGSAAEIQASSALIKEIDANTLRANATRSAWGYRMNAGNLRTEAVMARATARGINPVGSAATTLLGGATNVATSWYGLQRSGALKPAPQYSSLDAMAADQGWW